MQNHLKYFESGMNSAQKYFVSGVKSYEDEEGESLAKRFRKSVENDGILSDLKKRRFFKKPSVIKHEKHKEILFRIKKEKEKNSRPKKRRSRKKQQKKAHNSASSVNTGSNN